MNYIVLNNYHYFYNVLIGIKWYYKPLCLMISLSKYDNPQNKQIMSWLINNILIIIKSLNKSILSHDIS